MGYFPNGTAGDMYENQYCSKCVHRENKQGTGCAVMWAHNLHNYKECNKEDSILHLLIPLEKNGDNGICLLFWPGNAAVPDREEREQLRQSINPAYREWAQAKGIL